MLTLLATKAIERLLNTALYQDKALQAARWRLQGKVLRIGLRECDRPMVLIFGERLEVVNQWDDAPHASLETRLATLVKLRDRDQLTRLIRQGDLDVNGDLQVVQNFVALLDLAPRDLAHWLSFGLGDVGAQAVSQLVGAGTGVFSRHTRHARDYLAQAMSDEWRLAVCQPEASGFADDVAALACEVDKLATRLDKLEGK